AQHRRHPGRYRRNPGGGRRCDPGRRHPREVVHRRPRCRLAVDGGDRHRRRGQVRCRHPRRRARQHQDRRRRDQLHREEPV
ncbi:MAG: Acyl carrier protein, partial [uncultured Blastococcus sp.]